MWKVLLAVYAVLFMAVLELGKHTVVGWVLFVAVLAGFIWLRVNRLSESSFGIRFLAVLVLLVICGGILLVSWPPVKPVAAVEGSHKETGIIHTAVGDVSGVQ